LNTVKFNQKSYRKNKSRPGIKNTPQHYLLGRVFIKQVFRLNNSSPKLAFQANLGELFTFPLFI